MENLVGLKNAAASVPTQMKICFFQTKVTRFNHFRGLCNNYLEGGSKISKVGLKIKLHPLELTLK